MSDDLSHRLDEARKLFTAKNYEGALKILAACPQDDPRVVHNTVICTYLKAPGNHRAVLTQLDLPPPQRVKSLKPGALQVPHLVLQYEGQELAYLSAALLHLHNGSITEARTILSALATLGLNFPPSVRVRIAMLLHIAMRRASGDVSDIIGTLMADVTATQSDAALTRMLNLAFSDTSMLHGWFASSTRPNAERALYLNNLGVEAFADGKTAIASVFFARAAKALDVDPEACALVTGSVAYNAAVCSLARGHTSGVLPSLIKAHATMSGSPVLWIRLAQVLITKFHSGAVEEVTAEYTKNILAFAAAAQKRGGQRGVAPVPPHQYVATKTGAPLLAAAAMSLQTALGLLIEKDRIVDAAKRLAQSPENAHLLDSTLCMLAYVELSRGNYGVVSAIAADYNMIERDVPAATTPRTQAVMTCYNVEALCLANRSSQALRVLQSMDLGILVSRGAPNAAIEAMMTNLCVAYIMNGQWIKAFALAQQLTSKLASPYSQLIAIYLDLAQGNRTAANEAIEALPQQFVKAAKA